MKKGSTLFARGVIYLVGAAALAVCTILLPELVREESVGKPTNPLLILAFFAVAYTLAAIFFFALYQTHKLLNYIDKNKAFSDKSIRALQNIKICAISFSVIIFAAVTTGISIAKIIEPTEDVAGFITIGLIFTFVPSVIAVFVAVLQKVLAEAITLKSEHDLII